MNSNLFYKLNELLENEATSIMRSDEEMSIKIKRMNEIVNIQLILENYDALEPTLKKYFKQKYEKEKWENER